MQGIADIKTVTAVAPQNVICDQDKTYPNRERKNKFWEGLIAYFPLIRHGPHRKRSRCLATIEGYTDTHKHTHARTAT
jgi:hypothetical protein